MNRVHRLILAALILTLNAAAQTNTSELAPSPKTAEELKSLLLKASQRNTIASITGPYHLLATFETFTPDGKSAGAGSIERWSIAPTRQKTTTRFRGHTMTDYFVDDQHRYTDDGFDGTIMLYRVDESIFDSMPLSRAWERQQPSYKSMQLDAAPFDCALYQLSINSSSSPPPLNATMCVSKDNHNLALVQFQQLNIQYGNVTPFQDKSIPRAISITTGTVLRARVHLQQLDEALLEDAAMLPPADASSVSPGPDWLDTTRDEDRPRHRIEPAFSRRLKSDRIEGTVAVVVLRSRTGKIEDIEPIEGDNPELVQTVIDAVKEWTYAPLIREGKSVETISAVSFHFTARK